MRRKLLKLVCLRLCGFESPDLAAQRISSIVQLRGNCQLCVHTTDLSHVLVKRCLAGFDGGCVRSQGGPERFEVATNLFDGLCVEWARLIVNAACGRRIPEQRARTRGHGVADAL